MLVAVDHVPVHTNQTGRQSRLFGSTSSYVRRNAVTIFRAYDVRAAAGVHDRGGRAGDRGAGGVTPFLADWILNGDSSGHVQSLILGAVLAIAAVQMFALGVIGDALAGQRVMAQRAFERIRRVELSLDRAVALRARRGRGGVRPRSGGCSGRRTGVRLWTPAKPRSATGAPRACCRSPSARPASSSISTSRSPATTSTRRTTGHRDVVAGRVRHRRDALPAGRAAAVADNRRAARAPGFRGRPVRVARRSRRSSLSP